MRMCRLKFYSGIFVQIVRASITCKKPCFLSEMSIKIRNSVCTLESCQLEIDLKTSIDFLNCEAMT